MRIGAFRTVRAPTVTVDPVEVASNATELHQCQVCTGQFQRYVLGNFRNRTRVFRAIPYVPDVLPLDQAARCLLQHLLVIICNTANDLPNPLERPTWEYSQTGHLAALLIFTSYLWTYARTLLPLVPRAPTTAESYVVLILDC